MWHMAMQHLLLIVFEFKHRSINMPTPDQNDILQPTLTYQSTTRLFTFRAQKPFFGFENFPKLAQNIH